MRAAKTTVGCREEVNEVAYSSQDIALGSYGGWGKGYKLSSDV